MTERRHPRRAPRPAAVAAGALALFLAVLVLLAWQVRSGRDPALGAGDRQPLRVAQAPSRQVLVRKIVRRVIDEKVVEHDEAPEAVAAAPASAAPVVRSAPAVVYSAPAPAPAPAPIVTKTS